MGQESHSLTRLRQATLARTHPTALSARTPAHMASAPSFPIPASAYDRLQLSASSAWIPPPTAAQRAAFSARTGKLLPGERHAVSLTDLSRWRSAHPDERLRPPVGSDGAADKASSTNYRCVHVPWCPRWSRAAVVGHGLSRLFLPSSPLSAAASAAPVSHRTGLGSSAQTRTSLSALLQRPVNPRRRHSRARFAPHRPRPIVDRRRGPRPNQGAAGAGRNLRRPSSRAGDGRRSQDAAA